jgi:hypothetical protein
MKCKIRIIRFPDIGTWGNVEYGWVILVEHDMNEFFTDVRAGAQMGQNVID